MRLACQTNPAAGQPSTSGRQAPQPGSVQSYGSSRAPRSPWRGAPPARLRPARVTNEMREMRVKEVAEQLEDEEYIWVDPDNPTPRPEMAPLERTVSMPYEEALFTDAVDPEAMQYWFTEPPGGWQTEPRKLRKAHAEQPEGFDDFAHPGEGRTALAALREGQMLQGRVVAHLLYHGMQIDIGAEYDGLLPLGEEHWEGLVTEHSVALGQHVAVRIFKMREAPLFRFPIQLEAVDPALAERLPPSEEHIAPMDLRVMPMSVEELVEVSGRTDYKGNDVYLQTEGEVHAANGAHWHWEEGPQAVPPSLEQVEYITRVVAGL